MFLENLTDGEKAAFLGLAKRLIEADEILSPMEVQLLSSLTNAAGVAAATGTVADLAAAFHTRQSKASALFELLGLGLSDDEYHPAEATLVAEVSNALGFTKDELTWMESWIVREASLIEEAVDFMRHEKEEEI